MSKRRSGRVRGTGLTLWGQGLCLAAASFSGTLAGCSRSTCEENLDCATATSAPPDAGTVEDASVAVEASAADSASGGEASVDASEAAAPPVQDAADEADRGLPCDAGLRPGLACPPGDGVFLSPTGLDSGDGSRAYPVRTLKRALSLARSFSPARDVYACSTNGAFSDPMVVDTLTDAGLKVYGGFDCRTWLYSGDRPTRVAPAAGSVPLSITSVVQGVSFEDFSFEGADAAKPGGHSIAAMVASSSHVAFTRVAFRAGAGKDGADGQPMPNYDGSVLREGPAMAGNAAAENRGGAAQTCESLCFNQVHSLGGKGGDGTPVPPATGDGLPGEPDWGGVSPYDGKGGQAGGACMTGTGHFGALGPPGTPGESATTCGLLSAAGWKGGDGQDGTPGFPGQGGGGGGAYLASAKGGGGGGCGGCGGGGGRGGQAGGSSFALLTYRSEVALSGCTLTASTAGNGGMGSEGEAGQPGGFGGAQATGACPGGPGGNGGKGGASGGGAGGLAASIAYSGPIPTFDAATTMSVPLDLVAQGGAAGAIFGDAGAPSDPDAGPGGDGGAAAPGIRGATAEILEVPSAP